MAMNKFIVDTTNRLFILRFGEESFDVKIDLYSDAKNHWITDGLGTDPPSAIKFDFPIRTIGGDPIGGGQFAGDLYFLQYGWQIRPYEADHQLVITGNLFHDDGINLIVPTVGGYTVSSIINRSNLVIGVQNTEISELYQSTIAATGNVLLGSTASEILTTLSPSVNNFYNGMTFQIVDGINIVVRRVDTYLSNGTVYPVEDLPFAPNSGATIRILTGFNSQFGRAG